MPGPRSHDLGEIPVRRDGPRRHRFHEPHDRFDEELVHSPIIAARWRARLPPASTSIASTAAFSGPDNASVNRTEHLKSIQRRATDLIGEGGAGIERSDANAVRRRIGPGSKRPGADLQAPATGFEPVTVRLTVGCSAVELRGIATRQVWPTGHDVGKSRGRGAEHGPYRIAPRRALGVDAHGDRYWNGDHTDRRAASASPKSPALALGAHRSEERRTDRSGAPQGPEGASPPGGRILSGAKR